MSSIYELYVCEYQDEVVYVGHGIRGRHRHCSNGCSHVYELNKIHFLEGSEVLSTTVIHQDTNKCVVAGMEKDYILSRKPKFNKVMNDITDRQTKSNESKQLREFLRARGENILSSRSLEKYNELTTEFIGHFGHSGVLSGNLLLEGKVVYKRLNKDSLRFLARWLRSDGSVTGNVGSYFHVFRSALLDYCGYDILDKLK